jgi:hypothetical protein
MQLRRMIKKVAGEVGEKMLELSKLLNEAYHSEAYLNWGFQCFEQYLNQELGMGYRKGMCLVGIWDNVVDFSLPEEKIEKIGWTKMALLHPVMTKDNALDWVRRAEKMKVCQLNEVMDEMRNKQKKCQRLVFFLTPDHFEEARRILNKARTHYRTRSRAETLECLLREWDKNNKMEKKFPSKQLKLAA